MMEATNAKQILNNMYGLMMEINFHRSDEDVLAETDPNDPFIQKHLQKIRQLSAKYAAIANQGKFEKLKTEVQRLKQLGLEEIKRVLTSQEQIQLQPMFRKFEELTEADGQSILEDQELLQMIEFLKNKTEENDNDDHSTEESQ